MSKKDLIIEINKVVNDLAINGDTLLKNHNRMIDKTNEVLECEQVGNVELSLKYKQQVKDIAEVVVSRKEMLKKLINRLDELINELED